MLRALIWFPRKNTKMTEITYRYTFLMDKMISAKYWFLQSALSYLGTPYVWGGDDPSGFDCSGFVIECLKSAGILNEREDYTAESLRAL